MKRAKILSRIETQRHTVLTYCIEMRRVDRELSKLTNRVGFDKNAVDFLLAHNIQYTQATLKKLIAEP